MFEIWDPKEINDEISTAVLAAVLSWCSATAFAGEIVAYDQKIFDTLTTNGKPMVVVVHAAWCPTCKAQKPIQQRLMTEPKFKDYTMLTLDFDRDKTIMKAFDVAMQSTIIVFKGHTEVGRSVEETNRESIAALMQKASN